MRWPGWAGRRYWSLYKHLDGYFTWILNYILGRQQTAKPPARARPSPQFVRTKNKYSSLRIQRITAAGCHWWRAQLVLNLISVPRSHWPRARTFTLVLGTVMHGQGRAAILGSAGHWTLEGGVGTILLMSTRTLRGRRIVSYYVHSVDSQLRKR